MSHTPPSIPRWCSPHHRGFFDELSFGRLVPPFHTYPPLLLSRLFAFPVHNQGLLTAHPPLFRISTDLFFSPIKAVFRSKTERFLPAIYLLRWVFAVLPCTTTMLTLPLAQYIGLPDLVLPSVVFFFPPCDASPKVCFWLLCPSLHFLPHLFCLRRHPPSFPAKFTHPP